MYVFIIKGNNNTVLKPILRKIMFANLLRDTFEDMLVAMWAIIRCFSLWG